MDQILKQVSKVRRQLWGQSVMRALPWCALIAFTLCFIGLLVPKIWYLPYTFESWSRIWLSATGVGTVIVTLFIAWLKRPSRTYAALELDKRFGLRERVSSALDLSEADRNTPVGAALLDDAATKAERIDVRDQFPIRPTPHLPWALLPVAACVALFWVPDRELPEVQKLGANTQERLNNIKAQTKPILEQVKKLRKDMEEKGLQDSAEEFKKIEKKLEDLQKTETLDSKKLLSDFNDIKKEMEQRKDSLGSADSLKKAMDELKKIDKGPADKVADALKDGDFKQAEKEIEKILEQMKGNKLTPEQKNQMANQMKQMEKALDKAIQAQKDAVENLKKEIEKAEQAGDVEKAGQLKKKMEQAEKALAQAGNAEKMKEQMQKAADAMAKGDMQAAQQALEEMKDELGELAEDAEAMKDLEEMMNEMQDAKQASNCKKCNGQGCGACNGKGKGKGDKGAPSKNAQGEGQGAGEREETENDTKEFESQVREQMRKGETVFGGKVGGPNRKGITKEEARASILSATPEDPDAIENMALPKAQRDQQREYFDSLRSKK